MLQSKSFIFLILIIINLACNAAEKVKFYSSGDLKTLQLLHDEKGFHVVKDEKIIHIANYNLDLELRSISKDQLKVFLNNGYLYLKQINDNEFILRAYINGLGGNKIIEYLVCAGISLFVKNQYDLYGTRKKEGRKIGAEELKLKAECEKTIIDRAYEIYDKVIFEGILVMLENWLLSTDRGDDIEMEKVLRTIEVFKECKDKIRDETVLQMTELILKKQAEIEQQNKESNINEPEVQTREALIKKFEKEAEESRVKTAKFKKKWGKGPFDNPRLNQIEAENEKSNCVIS